MNQENKAFAINLILLVALSVLAFTADAVVFLFPKDFYIAPYLVIPAIFIGVYMVKSYQDNQGKLEEFV